MEKYSIIRENTGWPDVNLQSRGQCFTVTPSLSQVREAREDK